MMFHLATQMQEIIAAYRTDLDQLTAGNEAVEQLLRDALGKLVRWRVPSSVELGSAQAIFAFSFGQGSEGSPGRTNQALAAHLLAMLDDKPLPVFAQWEIAELLNEKQTAVAHKAVPRDGYLSTRGVAEQFKTAWEAQFGGVAETAVLLVAHPDHQVRCFDLLQEAGFCPLVPDGTIPWQQFGCDPLGYDPDSAQPWTRSRAAFVAYELSVRFGARPLRQNDDK